MKEYKYTINGTKYEVAVGNIEDDIVTVTVNGEEYKVEMEKQPEPEKKKPVVRPVAASKEPAPSQTSNGGSAQGNALKAPLPGVITDIKVAVGDEVEEDQPVVVLEAMKMANNLTAEKAGKVAAICVQIGQSVMEGDALVIFE